MWDKNSKLLAALLASVEIDAATDSHPNEMKFSGTLVRLDEPSTKAPNGSKGHRILIPKALAEKTYKTLIGMGVNYSSDLEKHQPTRKVGVIQKAWIEGNAIKVSGIIWKKDFPDAEKDLKQANLGMSFEASDISVEDPDAAVWRLSGLCFTGAAILYKASAAYFKTDALAASAMSAQLITTNNGGVKMANPKNKTSNGGASISVDSLVAAMTAANKPILDALNRNTAAFGGLQASIEASQADSISAKAKKALKNDDQDEQDGDQDDDDDMDSEAGDVDTDAVESKGKKIKAKKAAEEEDDEEASAEDEDELEDLDDDDNEDCNDKPGHINKKVPAMNKSAKTTVSTKGDKHKNVAASIDLSTLAAQVEDLAAARVEDQREIKRLKKQLSAQSVQLQAAGERTDRRSIGSAQLQSLLAKEGIDTGTLSASGEKMNASEFDIMAEKAGLSTVQRVAMKTEAAKLGIMDEGIVRRG